MVCTTISDPEWSQAQSNDPWNLGPSINSLQNYGGFLPIYDASGNVVGYAKYVPTGGQNGAPSCGNGINCGPTGPGGAPNKSFDPNDPGYQLAKALGDTGVYSMNSPCFVPGFYIVSGAAAYEGVAAGAGYGGAETGAMARELLPTAEAVAKSAPWAVWGGVVAKATGLWDYLTGKATSAINKVCRVP
jgi:hypothetical protein